MPFIILGGIYGGFFTPTEAAAVAAVYGMVVGMFVYKTLNVKNIYEILKDSAKGSAVVLFIVACASFFAWFCATQGISEMASQLLIAKASSKFMFLMIMNVILLIAGCFVDATSALYIFTPILLPVAIHFGYDPVALGVVMTFNLGIGLITPPVGADLYVACNICHITLGEISKHIMPFVVVSVIMLLIITYIPWTILILPELMGM
jgi:C4-dicarboxylate transporter DctM subunit